MVTVHFWPGVEPIREAQISAVMHTFYVIVIDYLGRSSVPLLSVISGWLLVVSFASSRRRPLRMVQDKARRLLLPMVLWSAIILLPFVLQAMVTGNMARLPHGGMGWINAFFALTGEPANFPLGFLRDVFLCAALGVGVLMVWRHSPPLGGALLCSWAVVELWADGMLLLRPQILVFFAAGMLLALLGARGRMLRPAWPLVIGLVAADVMMRRILDLDAMGEGIALTLSCLGRAAMSLFIWRVAILLRETGGALLRGLYWLEPHIFMLFCSHRVFVALVAPVWAALGIMPQQCKRSV